MEERERERERKRERKREIIDMDIYMKGIFLVPVIHNEKAFYFPAKKKNENEMMKRINIYVYIYIYIGRIRDGIVIVTKTVWVKMMERSVFSLAFPVDQNGPYLC